MSAAIPVIDLFAGPGGLGEGFASLRSTARSRTFDIRLSVEMDEWAHRTLTLRSFFRKFPDGTVPEAYYSCLRGEIELDELYARYPDECSAAKEEAWRATLGQTSPDEVNERIRKALGNATNWVLIGGPPCQAYSIAGRSRRRSDATFTSDSRHTLYREYLRILATHTPPVFVMENVKGLLSAKLDGESTFARVLHDLQQPSQIFPSEAANSPHPNAKYIVYPLVAKRREGEQVPADFVIKAEEFGIPQARHRVILLGVRSDLSVTPETLRPARQPVALWDVISDLPKIRSALSRNDAFERWRGCIQDLAEPRTLESLTSDPDLRRILNAEAGRLKVKRSTGGEFVRSKKKPQTYRQWYFDPRIGGACNHSSRSHIPADVQRYFYVAAFGKRYNQSPKLRDFPKQLLPKHRNVARALTESMFSDRFRVQLKRKPSTTNPAPRRQGHSRTDQ